MKSVDPKHMGPTGERRDVYAQRGTPPYGWVIVAVCLVLITVGYGLMFSFSVFFKPLAGQFGWNRASTSAVYSCCQVTRGLMAVVVGWIADRFGARRVLICCGVITALGYIVSSRVHTLPELFLAYGIVLAIGLSGNYCIGTSLVAQWFTKRNGLALGIVSTGSGLGTIIFLPVAARLIKTYAWSETFVIFGLAGGLITVLGALLLRRPPEREQLPGGPQAVAVNRSSARDYTLGEALRTPELYLIMCMFFAFVFVAQIVILHFVNYTTDLGLTPAKAAGLMSLLGIVSVVGRLFTGFLGDKVNNLVLVLGTVCMTVGAFLLLAVSSRPWSFYTFVLVFGLAYGGDVPLVPMITKQYFGTRAMATLVGVFLFAGSLGGALGPILAGRVYDSTHSYHLVFVLGAFLGAAILVPVFLLFWRGRHVAALTHSAA